MNKCNMCGCINDPEEKCDCWKEQIYKNKEGEERKYYLNRFKKQYMCLTITLLKTVVQEAEKSLKKIRSYSPDYENLKNIDRKEIRIEALKELINDKEVSETINNKETKGESV